MIRVTRKKAYADMFRAYKIYIDGIHRGNVKRNATKEFEIEKGKHTVCAKLDWGGSNEICVDVNDSVVELEVGNAVSESKKAFALERAFFTKDKWLFLREKNPVEKPKGDTLPAPK